MAETETQAKAVLIGSSGSQSLWYPRFLKGGGHPTNLLPKATVSAGLVDGPAFDMNDIMNTEQLEWAACVAVRKGN